MKPSEALPIHREAIHRIVAEHHARNPRIFGSVLTGTDGDGSDLDLLVDDTPETSLLDLARIERQLSELLGLPVDVRTPLDLPASFRGKIMAEARPI
jgi:hypothetical protein